eukprot:2977900-Prorocentrum_lima.AAC.1
MSTCGTSLRRTLASRYADIVFSVSSTCDCSTMVMVVRYVLRLRMLTLSLALTFDMALTTPVSSNLKARPSSLMPLHG